MSEFVGDEHVAQFEVDAARPAQAGHVPVVMDRHIGAWGAHEDSLVGGTTVGSTVHTGENHVACGVPLPNGQRPVTRWPPSTRTARPIAAVEETTKAFGSSKIADVLSTGKNAPIRLMPPPLPTSHPTVPSTAAAASTTSMNSSADNPRPPTAAGSHSRNTPIAANSSNRSS